MFVFHTNETLQHRDVLKQQITSALTAISARMESSMPDVKEEATTSSSITTPAASVADSFDTGPADANLSEESTPIVVQSTASLTVEKSAASLSTSGTSTSPATPKVEETPAKQVVRPDAATEPAIAGHHDEIIAGKSSPSPLKSALKSSSSSLAGKSSSSNPSSSSRSSSSVSSLPAATAAASSPATRRFSSQGPPPSPVAQALLSQAQSGYSFLSQSLSSLGAKVPAGTSGGNSTSSGGGNSSIPAASAALDPAVVAERAKEALKSAEKLQQSAKAAFSSFFTSLSPEAKPKSAPPPSSSSSSRHQPSVRPTVPSISLSAASAAAPASGAAVGAASSASTSSAAAVAPASAEPSATASAALSLASSSSSSAGPAAAAAGTEVAAAQIATTSSVRANEPAGERRGGNMAAASADTRGSASGGEHNSSTTAIAGSGGGSGNDDGDEDGDDSSDPLAEVLQWAAGGEGGSGAAAGMEGSDVDGEDLGDVDIDAALNDVIGSLGEGGVEGDMGDGEVVDEEEESEERGKGSAGAGAADEDATAATPNITESAVRKGIEKQGQATGAGGSGSLGESGAAMAASPPAPPAPSRAAVAAPKTRAERTAPVHTAPAPAAQATASAAAAGGSQAFPSVPLSWLDGSQLKGWVEEGRKSLAGMKLEERQKKALESVSKRIVETTRELVEEGRRGLAQVNLEEQQRALESVSKRIAEGTRHMVEEGGREVVEGARVWAEEGRRGLADGAKDIVEGTKELVGGTSRGFMIGATGLVDGTMEVMEEGRRGIVDGSKTAAMVLQTRARHLVSQNKRRYQQDGFDLDLSYVTEDVIAMGFPAGNPSSGLLGVVEGLYRNHVDDVLRFLETHHKDRYLVFNLCSERLYDPAIFGGRVVHLPFSDGHCPPLPLILDFCIKARDWLKHGIHEAPGRQQQQVKNTGVVKAQQQLPQQASKGASAFRDDRGPGSAAGSSVGAEASAASAAGGMRREGEAEGGGEFVFELGDEGSDRSDSFSSLREADTGAAAATAAATAGGGAASSLPAVVLGGEVSGEGAAAAGGVTVANEAGPSGDAEGSGSSRQGDEGRGRAGEGGESGDKPERENSGAGQRDTGADLESKGKDVRVVGSGSGEVIEKGVEKVEGTTKDEKRVIVVHCKAGMGRTGLMASALLMFLDYYPSCEEATTVFNAKRSLDGRALTLPSQLRYVKYFEDVLRRNQGQLPSPRKLYLRGIRLHKAPKWFRPSVIVVDHKRLLFHSHRHPVTKELLPEDLWYPSAKMPGVLVFALPGEKGLAQVDGDFRLHMHDKHGEFYCWLNTGFLPRRFFLKPSTDMDHFSKQSREATPGLLIELVFLDADAQLPARPKPTTAAKPATGMFSFASAFSSLLGGSAATTASTPPAGTPPSSSRPSIRTAASLDTTKPSHAPSLTASGASPARLQGTAAHSSGNPQPAGSSAAQSFKQFSGQAKRVDDYDIHPDIFSDSDEEEEERNNEGAARGVAGSGIPGVAGPGALPGSTGGGGTTTGVGSLSSAIPPWIGGAAQSGTQSSSLTKPASGPSLSGASHSQGDSRGAAPPVRAAASASVLAAPSRLGDGDKPGRTAMGPSSLALGPSSDFALAAANAADASVFTFGDDEDMDDM